MPKITKNNKYAVLWLNHNGLSLKDIAEELKITENQVSSVLEEQTEKKNNVKTSSNPVKASPSKNLMIRETANKKSHVAIMTKESSMINDEAKKNNTSINKTKETPGIYRPNGN